MDRLEKETREVLYVLSSCLLLFSMVCMAVLITVLLAVGNKVSALPYMLCWIPTIVLFMIGNKLRKILLIDDTKAILTIAKKHYKGNRMKKIMCVVVCQIDEVKNRIDIDGFEGSHYVDNIQALETISKGQEMNNLSVYTMGEFTDLCNNSEIDMSDHWITWITLENEIED